MYLSRRDRQQIIAKWCFYGGSGLFALIGLSRLIAFVATWYPYPKVRGVFDVMVGFTVLFTVVFIHRRAPFVLRALSVDRSARRKAETLNESLRDADHAKDEFLAIISHELRTPMASILGWSQLLQQEGMDASIMQQGLQAIEECSQVQRKLIEDLLETSRLTLGKVQVNLKPTDLAKVVREVVETYRPTISTKKLACNLLIEPVGIVNVDPQRIHQIIANLLSNSTKFTPVKGRIDITLDRFTDNVGNEYARICVCDNGRGFSPDALRNVWSKFQKSSGPAATHGGGLGLGLSIVKRLVEKHGGTTLAESAGEGKGSKFSVHLPMN